MKFAFKESGGVHLKSFVVYNIINQPAAKGEIEEEPNLVFEVSKNKTILIKANEPIIYTLKEKIPSHFLHPNMIDVGGTKKKKQIYLSEENWPKNWEFTSNHFANNENQFVDETGNFLDFNKAKCLESFLKLTAVDDFFVDPKREYFNPIFVMDKSAYSDTKEAFKNKDNTLKIFNKQKKHKHEEYENVTRSLVTAEREQEEDKQ